MKYSARIEYANDVALSEEMAVVYAYWQRIKGHSFAPAWRAFDWLALPTALIPWFAVVDVRRNPDDLTYRFFGSHRVRLQGSDYTGRSLRDVVPQTLAEKVYADTWKVFEERTPLYFETASVGVSPSNEPASYRFLGLPMSDTGEQVDHVLAFGMLEEDQIKRINNFFEVRDA